MYSFSVLVSNTPVAKLLLGRRSTCPNLHFFRSRRSMTSISCSALLVSDACSLTASSCTRLGSRRSKRVAGADSGAGLVLGGILLEGGWSNDAIRAFACSHARSLLLSSAAFLLAAIRASTSGGRVGMAMTAGECVGGAGVLGVRSILSRAFLLSSAAFLLAAMRASTSGGRGMFVVTAGGSGAGVGDGVMLLLSGDSMAAIASQSRKSILMTMAIAAMALEHCHHVFDGAAYGGGGPPPNPPLFVAPFLSLRVIFQVADGILVTCHNQMA